MKMDLEKHFKEARETFELAEQEHYENFWYVLFVKTSYEDQVRRQLSSFDFQDRMNVFTPTKERIIKLSNKITTRRKAMFPGYLFVETETKAEDFGYFIYRSRLYLQKLLKIVSYGTLFDIAMKDEERKFLEAIMNKERCVAASEGIIVGDRTIITEGPLVGQEGIIKKIDRHKRRAFIELPMFGQLRSVEVALTIAQKTLVSSNSNEEPQGGLIL